MELPLAGVTVVALEQAVAAPFATRQMADWGARVIKVERTGGGDFARRYDRTVNGLSSYLVWLNRSKESLCLDLKAPGAAEILDRLLARADVLVENLAPGAVDRLGLDDAALRARHRRLVVAHVSGYGRRGPYSRRKAYDLLIQSEAGLLSLTGTPAERAKVGTPVADIAAGMYTLTGVLLALRERDRTGTGSVVEVPMLDSLAEWLGHAAYFATYGGTPPPRSGADHATIAPYGLYAAGDGESLFLAIQNEREWVRFCADVLSRPDLAVHPDLADNPLRVRHRALLDREIARALAPFSIAQVRERLDRAQIAFGDYRPIEALMEHPQLTARDRWREVDTPAGPVRALAPPMEMGVDARMGAVPAAGRDSEAILAEIGFGHMEIARLRSDGVIDGPTEREGAPDHDR